MYPVCSVIKCCDLLLSLNRNSHICVSFPELLVTVHLEAKYLEPFTVALRRGGYNDTNNCDTGKIRIAYYLMACNVFWSTRCIVRVEIGLLARVQYISLCLTA